MVNSITHLLIKKKFTITVFYTIICYIKNNWLNKYLELFKILHNTYLCITKKKWTPFKMRKSWPIIISCLWSSTIIFFSNLFVRQKNRNDDRQEIWVLVSENLGGFRSMGLYRLVYFEEFSIKSGGGVVSDCVTGKRVGKEVKGQPWCLVGWIYYISFSFFFSRIF